MGSMQEFVFQKSYSVRHSLKESSEQANGINSSRYLKLPGMTFFCILCWAGGGFFG